MQADTALLCGFCFKPFNLARKPLAMPNCLHTVCVECVGQDEQAKEEGGEEAEEGKKVDGGGGQHSKCLVCGKGFVGKPRVRFSVVHAVLSKAHGDGGGEGEGEGDGAAASQCQGCPNQHHAATHHCRECNENLCATAIPFHLHYKRDTPHTIAELATGLPGEPSLCAEHNEPVVHVCQDDDHLVCHQCVVSPHHRGHKFQSPDEARERKLRDLRGLVDDVAGKVSKLGEGAVAMKSVRDEVLASIVVAEAEIKQFFDEVLKIRGALLSDLDKAKKRISQQYTDMVTTSKALQHASCHAQSLLDAGEGAVSNLRVVVATRQLQDQLRMCDEDIQYAPLVEPPVRFSHEGVDLAVLQAKCKVSIGDKAWALAWDAEKSHPSRKGDIVGHTVSVSQEGYFYVVGKQPIRARSPHRHHFTIRADKLGISGDLAVGVTSRDSVSDLKGFTPKDCWVWFSYSNNSCVYADGVGGAVLTPKAKAGASVKVVVQPSEGLLTFSVGNRVSGTMKYPGDVDVRPVMCLCYSGAAATVESSGVL